MVSVLWKEFLNPTKVCLCLYVCVHVFGLGLGLFVSSLLSLLAASLWGRKV